MDTKELNELVYYVEPAEYLNLLGVSLVSIGILLMFTVHVLCGTLVACSWFIAFRLQQRKPKDIAKYARVVSEYATDNIIVVDKKQRVMVANSKTFACFDSVMVIR